MGRLGRARSAPRFRSPGTVGGGSWGSSANGMGMERPDSSITLPPSRVKRTGPTMLVVLPRSSALATPSSVSLPKSGQKS